MQGEGCRDLKILRHQRHRRHHDVDACLRGPAASMQRAPHPTGDVTPASCEDAPRPLCLPGSAQGPLRSLPGTLGEGPGLQAMPDATNRRTRQSTTLSELPSIFNLLDPRENNNRGEGEGREEESILGKENNL